MKNNFLLLTALLFFFFGIPVSAQVTGLAGWNVYVDPGHSMNENMGAYNYSEARKVLRVGLALQEMLLTETDIDTVYICRTNDQQSVSLTQRTDHANAVAAAWYHSIHSDAPSLTANSTLMLWGQYSNGLEKVPNGGKAMSALIVDLLTRGYRTNTRGSFGDCTFYGCTGTGPYLHVNRQTTMPSELSEAGFHTNPTQNTINMNALWKRLEARTFYWSFLKFKNITRPYVGIAAGHVKDADGGFFINGAVVTLNGQTLTTDTYESLFYQYSTDSNALRNGFYYFENIPAGTHTLTVTKDGYDPFTQQVTMSDTFFTFVDPQLVLSTPPVILSTTPDANDSLYPGTDNIIIQFSRPMDKASVESNISITPSANITYSWADNDRRLTILTADLSLGSSYSITISGNSKDRYDHFFDGNGDGTGGDSFTLNFKTQVLDIFPPYIAQAIPSENAIYASIQPVINLTFNELLSIPTLSGKLSLVKTSDQSNVTGVTKYYTVNGRGVLSYFVRTELDIFTNYTVKLAPGIKDQKGNEITSAYEYSFNTGPARGGTSIVLDGFEGGISNWLQPTQSNSTVGVIAAQTSITSATNIFNALTFGTKSMKLNAGWDTTVSNWLIREFYVGASHNLQSVFTLKVHLFGDGLNNKFRFCVREGGGYEVSPWVNVDWYGWKEVDWTPSIDGFGQWNGDGNLTGTVVFDSYQFTYNPGSKTRNEYYIDDAMAINNPLVDVKDEPVKPKKYALEQNYPNPFNPATNIKFSLAKSGYVKLEVYNLIGQKVAEVVNGNMNAGIHQVNFDAEGLSSGVYVYKLTTPEFTSSKKLVIMK